MAQRPPRAICAAGRRGRRGRAGALLSSERPRAGADAGRRVSRRVRHRPRHGRADARRRRAAGRRLLPRLPDGDLDDARRSRAHVAVAVGQRRPRRRPDRAGAVVDVHRRALRHRDRPRRHALPAGRPHRPRAGSGRRGARLHGAAGRRGLVLRDDRARARHRAQGHDRLRVLPRDGARALPRGPRAVDGQRHARHRPAHGRRHAVLELRRLRDARQLRGAWTAGRHTIGQGSAGGFAGVPRAGPAARRLARACRHHPADRRGSRPGGKRGRARRQAASRRPGRRDAPVSIQPARPGPRAPDSARDDRGPRGAGARHGRPRGAAQAGGRLCEARAVAGLGLSGSHRPLLSARRARVSPARRRRHAHELERVEHVVRGARQRGQAARLRRSSDTGRDRGEGRHAGHGAAARLPRSRSGPQASARPRAPGSPRRHGPAARAEAHDRRAASSARRRDPRRVRAPILLGPRGRRGARSRHRRSAGQRQLPVAFGQPISVRRRTPRKWTSMRCWIARATACIRPARRSS